MVDVAADQHQLILAIAGPVGVIERKSIARQMEHMAAFGLSLNQRIPFARNTSSGICLSRKFWNLRREKGPSLWKDTEVNPSMS